MIDRGLNNLLLPTQGYVATCGSATSERGVRHRIFGASSELRKKTVSYGRDEKSVTRGTPVTWSCSSDSIASQTVAAAE
jgi:hypothetical protein